MLHWDNPINRTLVGIELLREMEEKILNIKQNLKASQDRNKIYAAKNSNQREFKVSDHVFLKVKANINSLKLGNYSKLVAIYCGSFEILERIGLVVYMISFSASISIHNVFHISLLKKYIPGANHVIDWNVIQVEKESAFQVHPVHILDQKIKQLDNRTIGLVC
jgi:hypothetical protein